MGVSDSVVGLFSLAWAWERACVGHGLGRRLAAAGRWGMVESRERVEASPWLSSRIRAVLVGIEHGIRGGRGWEGHGGYMHIATFYVVTLLLEDIQSPFYTSLTSLHK